MTAKQRLVVIGNGMAGGRFVQELCSRNGQQHFDIVAIGDELYGNYNRTLLSGVLSGTHESKDIFLNPVEWYEANGIALRTGVRVEAVDRSKRLVIAANGVQEPYDRLVFATGSRPFVPPIQGLARTESRFLDGVFVFRTLDDAFQIIKFASNARKPVVLGGGLLGLEAARGLLNSEREVHVVELMTHLMAVQLDASAGRVLQSTLAKMGVRFHLGKSITMALGTDRIEGVQFNDGSSESCDMLVISAGIRPNVEIARQAGLSVERGIVVGDDLTSVSDPAIHAIGECAQHRGQTYGIAAPGSEQAKVLAERLSLTNPRSLYFGSNTSTTLKVMGVDLVVLGEKEPATDSHQVHTYTDGRRGIYQKLIMNEGRVSGAILLGDRGPAPRLLRAFHKKESISENPANLLFPSTTKRPDIDIEDESALLNPAQEDAPGQPLKEVIAIIRPERWYETKSKVESLGISAFTHHRVVGRGRQRGLQFLARRGATAGTGLQYLPKRMISWIVAESQVDGLVQAIMEVNRTGQIGDGKLFVLPLDGMAQIGGDESRTRAQDTTEKVPAHA